MSSKIEYIEPNPSKGFNFGYFLLIPGKCYETNQTTLIAEMNNPGRPVTEAQELIANVVEYLTKSKTARMISDLGLPYLIPLFPRCEGIYTHALSREAILSDDINLKRIDQQFINMINDAKERLKTLGINIEEKFILNGFSASGAFSNRFAIMYPQLLKGVISGGQTYAMLPLKEYEGIKLTYPIGIADLEDVAGIKFNSEEYFNLPQFIYEGDQNDHNDTTKFSECMTKEQAEMIYSLFGNLPKSKRLDNQIKLFEVLNFSNIDIRLYEGQGHKPQVEDIKKYLEKLLQLNYTKR